MEMSYLRHMKTTAESRAVSAAEEQGAKVRAKRNYANIPNAWDDVPHSRRGRSDRYKNHRRK
jgi:hypothetical protein